MKKIILNKKSYRKLYIVTSFMLLLSIVALSILGLPASKGGIAHASNTTKTWISDRVAVVGIAADQFSATQVSGSGAWYDACGVSNGAAYCWGNNADGELGDGTTTNRNTPTASTSSGVLSGKTITAISAGTYNTCAVANGAAYCWGRNDAGALGNGTYTNSTVPVAVYSSGVLSGKKLTDISSGFQQVCAVANGAAYCWGWNDSGELGNGSGGYGTYSNVPVAVYSSGVLSGKSVDQVAAGKHFSCAVANGAAYCWGNDLGNGTWDTSYVPVAVSTSGYLNGKKVIAISAGNLHACVLADGGIYCWGANNLGQLGNGTSGSSTSSNVPIPPTTSGVLSGKVITNISVGAGYTCVVASGKAYCWGYNVDGQLGDGTTTQRNTPVAVSTSGVLNGKTVTSISAGASTTCALANGQSYCWGKNDSGQLGNGTTSSSLVPVAVSAPAS